MFRKAKVFGLAAAAIMMSGVVAMPAIASKMPAPSDSHLVLMKDDKGLEGSVNVSRVMAGKAVHFINPGLLTSYSGAKVIPLKDFSDTRVRALMVAPANNTEKPILLTKPDDQSKFNVEEIKKVRNYVEKEHPHAIAQTVKNYAHKKMGLNYHDINIAKAK